MPTRPSTSCRSRTTGKAGVRSSTSPRAPTARRASVCPTSEPATCGSGASGPALSPCSPSGRSPQQTHRPGRPCWMLRRVPRRPALPPPPKPAEGPSRPCMRSAPGRSFSQCARPGSTATGTPTSATTRAAHRTCCTAPSAGSSVGSRSPRASSPCCSMTRRAASGTRR